MGDFNAVSAWDLEDRPEVLATLGRYTQTNDLLEDSQGPNVIAQMENAGYVDAYRLHGKTGVRTFIPAVDLPMRIDYIFASKALANAVEGCQIWQEAMGQEASDHRPVLAVIRTSSEVA
jgi:exonuclease III